jgi:plastocyanin
MVPRRPAVLVAALILALVPAGLGLAGCGGGSKGGGATAGDNAAATSDDGGLGNAGEGPDDSIPADTVKLSGKDVQVVALDNTFRAADIEVKAGTKVTWTNRGRNDHDVLPTRGHAWGSTKAGMPPGATYTTTFDRPGVYHYYCSIHGTTARGMVGTVVVTK